MTEHTYTIADLEQLADLLAPRIASCMPQHICQFSTQDVGTLVGIAVAARAAKRTSFLAAVGAGTIGILTLIGAGIVTWIRRELGQ